MPSNTSDAWQLRWRDYYQALGIYCEASEQEVKHAFALKARLLHPDHLAGHSEDVRGIANGEMRLLIEARDVLQDQASRARYDKAYKLRDVSPAEAEAERLRERASQERERQAARDDGYRNGYAEASAKLQLAVAAARQEGFQAGEASAWTKVRDNSPIWCDFEASWLSAPPVFGQSPALQLQMEAYLVAAASTNQQLESELRRSPGGWRRMHYVWLVLRAEDTETFYNKLHNTLPDQFLLVMAVRQPCQGWLPRDDWDWLSRYLPTTNASPPVPNLQFPGYFPLPGQWTPPTPTPYLVCFEAAAPYIREQLEAELKRSWSWCNVFGSLWLVKRYETMDVFANAVRTILAAQGSLLILNTSTKWYGWFPDQTGHWMRQAFS